MPLSKPELACLAAGQQLRSNVVYVDRSRIVAREECPQRRDWEYHYILTADQPVPGIQLKARSVPLVTGAAVHEGLAELMNQALSNNRQILDEHLNRAVDTALNYYNQQVEDRGFSSGVGPQSGPTQWIIQEQKALTEALIYVGRHRVLEPILKSDHQILSVEQERMTWIGEDPDLDLTIIYLSRADLEMYDPQTGQLYVINYKTAKRWDDRDQEKLAVNPQTIGEPAALKAAYEARHQELDGEFLYPELQHLPDHLYVAGVQYITLVKGEQRYDGGRGHKVTYSPLTRAWAAVNPLTGQMQYTWRYYHPDSKRQVLSKASGFHPFESYPGGTRQWLEDLAANRITGGEPASDALAESLVMPAMCNLHPARQERWQNQVVRDETRWFLDQSAGRPPSQHTSACGSGEWKCPYYQLCHDLMPAEAGNYEPRKANHDEGEEGGGD